MDYRYLKAFLDLAGTLNFSKSARNLSIAQSAVTRQIQLLEKDLGKDLFIRSNKKVMLTAEGEKLRDVFLHAEKALTQNSGPQLVRIGLVDGFLVEAVYRSLKKLSAEHPFLSFDMSVTQAHLLHDKLFKNEVDLIITQQSFESAPVTSLKISEQRLALISASKIDTKRIEKEKWIYGYRAESLSHISSQKPDSYIRTDSLASIISLVEMGVGVAVVPLHSIPKNFRGQVSAVTSVKKSGVYLSTLNYQKIPQILKETISVIKKEFSLVKF